MDSFSRFRQKFQILSRCLEPSSGGFLKRRILILVKWEIFNNFFYDNQIVLFCNILKRELFIFSTNYFRIINHSPSS